jgi:hypothetical protein
MKAKVRKINGVRGFISTTYAVYVGEKIIKIFVTKKEAEKFANEISK